MSKIHNTTQNKKINNIIVKSNTYKYNPIKL